MIGVLGTRAPASEEKKRYHEEVVAMGAAIMSTTQRQNFKESQEVDLAYSVPGLGRFRCNIFQQRGTVALALPAIPMQLRATDALARAPVPQAHQAHERWRVPGTAPPGHAPPPRTPQAPGGGPAGGDLPVVVASWPASVP